MAKYKNKWLSLTLALAVAFSALLPFFAVHNPSNHLSSVFGERVLICTGDGFKWVNPADLQSGKEKPKPHSGDKCPLCYAARHSLAIASSAPAHDYHEIHALVSVRSHPGLIALYRASLQNVRAPPSFIS